MSEAVIVALIAAIPGLLASTIGGINMLQTRRVRRDTAATRVQVENDHTTNLREENTSNHVENKTMLLYLVEAVAWLIDMAVDNRADITGLQEHTGQGGTRRARRLARSQPPVINTHDIPTNLEGKRR